MADCGEGSGDGVLALNRPLPGSRAGTDLARLGNPSFSELPPGLLSSLTLDSQKEKRDEKAMLAGLQSWAEIDEVKEEDKLKRLDYFVRLSPLF